MNWKFNADEYEENTFQLIPVGDYQAKIVKAEEKKSNSGNDMIELTLEINGYKSTVRHYIVLMPDNTKLTNQKIGEIINSFAIPRNSMNIQKDWVGRVGACRIKHEEYNGSDYAKVHYFISRDKQDGLAEFKGQVITGNSAIDDNFAPVSPDDLPF